MMIDLSKIRSKPMEELDEKEIVVLKDRLQRERSILQQLRRIRELGGETYEYRMPLSVNTTISEMYHAEEVDDLIAIKKRTIAELSDKELAILQRNLVKELSILDTLGDLQYLCKTGYSEGRGPISMDMTVDEILSHDDVNKVQDFLAHYGVPGMKWGVRKSKSGYIKARATLNRRDRKEQEYLDSNETNLNTKQREMYNAVYKKAASKIRKGTRLLNSDPKYKDQNFKIDSPLRQEYYKQYSKMVTDQLNAAATSKKHPFTNQRIGMSPKRTLQMKFSFDYTKELRASYDVGKADTAEGIRNTQQQARLSVKGGSAAATVTKKIKEKTLKHEDQNGSVQEIIVDLITDDDGYIIGFDEEILKQSDIDAVDSFLAHYGIPGMKWGVRKKRPTSTSRKRTVSRKTTTSQKNLSDKAKKTIEKSEDYIESQKLKSKTPKGLTNSELKKLNERLNLERQYRDLSKTDVNKGKSFVSKALDKGLEQTVTTVVAAASLYAVKKIVEKTMGESASTDMFPKDKKKKS